MSPKIKKIISIVCVCSCILAIGVFSASAAEVAEVVTMDANSAIDAAQDLFAQITSVVNFANISKVIGIGLGAVLGIWLAWWGIRKLFGMLQNAIRSGKIKM